MTRTSYAPYTTRHTGALVLMLFGAVSCKATKDENAPPFDSQGSGANAGPMGHIVGQIIAMPADPLEGAAAFSAAGGAQIILLRDGVEVATEVASGDGRWEFTELARGDYEVHVTADGASTTLAAATAGGTTTQLNFAAFSEPDRILGGYAAMVVDLSVARDPDLNGDGIVDLRDLEQLEENFEIDPDDSDADLDGNGVIDDGDVVLLKQSFGRVVLRSGAQVATVTPLAVVTIALGDDGSLPASAFAEMTGRIGPVQDETLVITADSATGTVTVEEFGEFEFTGSPETESMLVADLKTGRVQAWTAAFNVTHALGSSEVVVTASDGFVAFAPGGFEMIELLGVSGELPADVPDLGGLLISATGPCPPKPKVACVTNPIPAGGNGTTGVDALGTTHICVLGDACAAPGAACDSGTCGDCTTFASRGGGGWYCDCRCL